MRPGSAKQADVEKTVDSDGPLTSAPPPAPSHNNSQPNGGLWAWLQVAGGFCIFFNTWGVLNTFGIFQTYYETGALFNESSSNISWIGSLQAYCVMIVGLISGPVYDRGYLRALLLSGSFLIVFGFMMLSICRNFWEALLAQGFCIGIGAGLLFVPSLAILPTYFSTKIGLAMGLAASGSSLGGVIYPIVFYRLIDQIGFSWSVRVIGFIALGTLLLPICFMRMRIKPAKPRAILDWSAFTDWPFAFFTLSTMIGFIGLYAMLFYISYFAAAANITTAEMSFYVIPILNASSMFGRTIPNAISDKIGPLNCEINMAVFVDARLLTNILIVFGPAGIICGVLTFCMLSVKTLGGILPIAILYGFFSGVFIALPGVCFVELTADKSKIGTRIGMGFAMFGFGVLAGGPGGGSIVGNNVIDLHWQNLWIYGACTMMASGVLLFAQRFWMSKGEVFIKI
jgi:MFS family permease